MGVLLNKANKNESTLSLIDTIVLRLNHTIGRAKHNRLVISEPEVSKSHATLYWFNQGWYLKDHSSNGTLLNGQLIVHEAKKVKKGDVLQFGKSEQTMFVLEAHHAPSSFLFCVSNPESKLVLQEASHYPKENPEVSFFRINNTFWYIDDGVKEQQLVDGNVYPFSGEDWEFVENEPLEDTLIYKESNQNLLFQFSLSSDQENIRLVLSDKDTKCDLGQRIHNHLLLILAREKANDNNDGVEEGLSGWVDMDTVVKKLRKELMQPNIDQYYINLMIHRIRKQFSKDLPFETSIADLIERDNGKLRFRYNNIDICTEA